MVRHRRLAETQWPREVADAGFARRFSFDYGKKPQPVGVGEGLEHHCLPFGFLGTQGRLARRLAAVLHGGRLECG